MCAVAVLMLEVSVWHGILMHLARARVLARALGRDGLGRVHVSRRSGRGSGASVSWRVLHETKNRFHFANKRIDSFGGPNPPLRVAR
jgi:hypothetical protein